jgi:geranylgeranyl diphosphate synthase type II
MPRGQTEPFNLEHYLAKRRGEVDRYLRAHLPSPDRRPAVLHRAIRYSVLAGGKRLRPILAIAAAEACARPTPYALAAGAAIELLHTYTLIHDDLPCMDDDDWRRGRPTCHVKFGEANALLAGDALLTLAFEWLSDLPPAASPAQLVWELARAAGSSGVVGGQVEDLLAERSPPSPTRLRYIHLHKTARLIEATVRIGALASGASGQQVEQLGRYGRHVGLAFQIADDLLNISASRRTLGKPVGTDEVRGKLTWPRVYGREAAKQTAERHVRYALRHLRGLPGDDRPLQALALYAIERSR